MISRDSRYLSATRFDPVGELLRDSYQCAGHVPLGISRVRWEAHLAIPLALAGLVPKESGPVFVLVGRKDVYVLDLAQLLGPYFAILRCSEVDQEEAVVVARFDPMEQRVTRQQGF
jgi:hypothetical protein